MLWIENWCGRNPLRGLAEASRPEAFPGTENVLLFVLSANWACKSRGKAEGDKRESRLVFIGLGLPQALMMRSLQQCLV